MNQSLLPLDRPFPALSASAIRWDGLASQTTNNPKTTACICERSPAVTYMAAASEGCPCRDKEQFLYLDNKVLRGEFELPTAGDVEWLLFSYT